MKPRRALVLCFVALVCAIPIALAESPGADFPGVEKAMPRETFERAGLGKLTPEERGKLDDFIRNYVASSSQKAVTEAVDKAVEQKKGMPPEIIQSNIVGPFRGYHGRDRFSLANGQVWAQSQQVTRLYPAVDSPPVLIVKDRFGYRMYIAGGGNIRVSRMH
jgi:hypothetical protein